MITLVELQTFVGNKNQIHDESMTEDQVFFMPGKTKFLTIGWLYLGTIEVATA